MLSKEQIRERYDANIKLAAANNDAARARVAALIAVDYLQDETLAAEAGAMASMLSVTHGEKRLIYGDLVEKLHTSEGKEKAIASIRRAGLLLDPLDDEYIEGIKFYEENNDLLAAGGFAEKQGDFVKAAELYEQAFDNNPNVALKRLEKLYEKNSDVENLTATRKRLIKHYMGTKQLSLAADIHELLGEKETADSLRFENFEKLAESFSRHSGHKAKSDIEYLLKSAQKIDYPNVQDRIREIKQKRFESELEFLEKHVAYRGSRGSYLSVVYQLALDLEMPEEAEELRQEGLKFLNSDKFTLLGSPDKSNIRTLCKTAEEAEPILRKQISKDYISQDIVDLAEEFGIEPLIVEAQEKRMCDFEKSGKFLKASEIAEEIGRTELAETYRELGKLARYYY